MTAHGSIFHKDLFAGKVALITGGGTGICRGITEALAEHGAQTVIVSRKLETLAVAAAEIEAAYGQPCLPLAADVRKPDEIEAAIAVAIARCGRIDFVINGAAGNFLCPAAALSYNAMKTVLEIDTLGTWNVTKAAFDAYLRDNGGQILNISATLHYGATPLQLHPSVAKAGVDAMTRSLAVEWGPLNIRVNAIAPGPIADTEGMKRLLPEDLKEAAEQQIPLQRFGRVRDIASSALFILSDAASFITGATLVVDGGQWLTGSQLWGKFGG
jgi:peroxisomal 2,4-dienoyl-CoA reductase